MYKRQIQFNGSDIIINANFVVNGTTTTVNTETVLIADNIITLNSNYTGNTPTENAGIEVERGTLSNVSIRWNETTDKWELTSDGTTFYTITTSNDSPNVIAGAGITVTTVGNQVTVAHTDTLTANTSSNANTTVIQSIGVDTFGHVTSIGTTELKYVANVGDGSNTQFVVYHGKNDENILIQVFERLVPSELVECDVVVTSTNDIELTFALPPQVDEFKVIII